MHSRNNSLPSKEKDFSAWYNALVKRAGLIDDVQVRGCMVFRPYGFALWESMKHILDDIFKATGHKNAYFPLFIPLSHLSKEAEHVEGFAKECAVVTHYRLKSDQKGGIVPDPDAALEEPMVVRPTSETIIWNMYSKWVHSYRDLPILLNQWANVVRWEMRTRPFLRTAEILWQEGHTAHSSQEEARAEAIKMHDVYANFMRDYLALPVIQGEKTEHERFAGAVNSYTLEALMQDGKGLQLGTSHFLGQNFAKAFNVRFSDEKGSLQYAWGTSWGVTTRLIGALIMTHSDDKGLVLPPKIAPTQVVIIPIVKKRNKENEAILVEAKRIQALLVARGIRVILDDNIHHSPGWKFTEYELQGIPVRLTLGSRDLAEGTVEMVRRDDSSKVSVERDNLPDLVAQALGKIQSTIFARAKAFQAAHTTHVDSYEEFKKVLARKVPGFISAHWDGSMATEKKIQEETQATIRCIPSGGVKEEGFCIYSGKPSVQRVLFAKAY